MSFTNSNPIGDRLSIRMVVGTDPETGNPIRRTRSYSNVKPVVSDADVHKFAELVVALIDYNGADQVQRHVGNALLPENLSGGAL